MPLDGAGHFTPIEPQFPAVSNTVILAGDYNDIWNDAAESISMAMFRDGQAEVIADIPFWEHKITRLAAGVADTDATNFDQVFHNPTFQSTVAGDPEGVVIEGNRFTLTTGQFYTSSDDVQFTGDVLSMLGVTATLGYTTLNLDATTFDVDSTNVDITTVADVLMTIGDDWLVNVTGDTTITCTSITLTGTTTAYLGSASIADNPGNTDDSTRVATTHFVQQVVATGAFPIGAGNNRKLVWQDAGDVKWTGIIDAGVVGFADSVDITKTIHFDLSGITTATDRDITIPNASFTMVGHNTTQTLSNKTIEISGDNLQLFSTGDSTKEAHFNLSLITPGQDRVLSISDEDILLFTPGLRLLETMTASNSASIEIDNFNSSYDNYIIECYGITAASGSSNVLRLEMKVSGAYLATGYYAFGDGDAADQNTIIANIFDDFQTGSGENAVLTIKVYNAMSTTLDKNIIITGNHTGGASGGSPVNRHIHNVNSSSAALDAIRLTFSGVNISTGTFKIYGQRK